MALSFQRYNNYIQSLTPNFYFRNRVFSRLYVTSQSRCGEDKIASAREKLRQRHAPCQRPSTHRRRGGEARATAPGADALRQGARAQSYAFLQASWTTLLPSSPFPCFPANLRFLRVHFCFAVRGTAQVNILNMQSLRCAPELQ